MRKTVESRQNMQQQKWKTKGDVKLKLYSISELYFFLSMFRINYDFLKSWTDRVTILKSLENVSGSFLTYTTAQTVANTIIIASGTRNHIY